jgi:hypothetical protein
MIAGLNSDTAKALQIHTININPYAKDNIQYEYNSIDTIFSINIIRNDLGIIDGYYSNIETEVCSEGICKPVFVIIYWDEMGNYISYYVDKLKPLYKGNNVQFSKEDYKRLHDILSQKNWTPSSYTLDQLITKSENLSYKIDGYTRATAKLINNEDLVEGALYTVYTLWHIANNPLKKSEMLTTSIGEMEDQRKINLLQSIPLADLPPIIDLINPRYGAYGIKDKYELIKLIEFVPNEIYAEYVLECYDVNSISDLRHLLKMYPATAYRKQLLHACVSYEADEKFIEVLASFSRSVDSYEDINILIRFFSQHVSLITKNSGRFLSDLLSHSNNFISNDVYELLKNVTSLNLSTKEKMRKYAHQQL